MASYGDGRLRKYKRLSADIESMYEREKQTRAEYEKKDRWRADVEHIITQRHPYCRLVLCGSSANGFGSSGCDIDLGLFLPPSASFGARRPSLYDIDTCFTRVTHRFRTEVISSAFVPILKIKDKSSCAYESDISVDNLNALRNTFLMSCYAQADPRVAPLVVIVKLWAENADIKGARFHRLSGFALALLVLHFLQAGCQPPVVPALQRRFPNIIPSDKNTIIQHVENRTVPSCIHSLKSDNTQSLGELLMGFFQYYCSFSWSDTISVRNGCTQSTPYGKKWRNPHIRMEDPGDLGNVTRSVFQYHEFSLIKGAFQSAKSNLQRSLSLDSIFESSLCKNFKALNLSR